MQYPLYLPCVECVFMFLYDMCSIVTSTDERMSQVDDLVKMALVHCQLLQNEILYQGMRSITLMNRGGIYCYNTHVL